MRYALALVASGWIAWGSDAGAGPVEDPLVFVWQKGQAEVRMDGAHEAHPFRGRLTPMGGVRLTDAFASCTAPDCSAGGGLGASGFDSVAALEARNADLVAIAPFVGEGFDGIAPDPFPDALVFFLNHPLNRNGIAIFPFQNFTNPATGRLTSLVFGGDYSGRALCLDVSFDDGDSSYERQLQGIFENTGCIPRTLRSRAEFNAGDPDQDGDGLPGWDGPSNSDAVNPNVRVIGGVGEQPLRPGPDRSNLFSLVDPAIAQGRFLPPSPALATHARNVDPTTGRPRIAGSSDPCTGLADPGGAWTAANADPRDHASMTVAELASGAILPA